MYHLKVTYKIDNDSGIIQNHMNMMVSNIRDLDHNNNISNFLCAKVLKEILVI